MIEKIMIFCLAFLFSNCAKTNDLNKLNSLQIKAFSKISGEFNLKYPKLNYKSFHECLIFNNDTLYFNIYTPLDIDSDSIIFLMNKKLYFTDLNFDIKKYYIFEDGFGIRKYQNTLLYGDEKSGLNIFNLLNSQNKRVYHKNPTYRTDKVRASYYYVDKVEIISTTEIIPSEFSDSLVIGRTVNFDGKILRHFIVGDDYLDTLWTKKVDFPFCTVYNDKVYFSFVFSSYVYKFSLDGNFERRYKILSDQDIIGQQNINNPYNVILRNELLFFNDMIYQIINTENKVILLLYDLNFIPKQIYELDIAMSDIGYRIYAMGHNLIISSIDGIYVVNFPNFTN